MDGITEQKGRPTVTLGKQTDSREDRGKDTISDGNSAFQGSLTGTTGRKSNKSLFRFVEQSDQLLPGIPDDITLNQIVPKLQWRVFHVLSSVSYGWQQAIQNHQVHEARVRSNLTETFVAIHSTAVEEITLYSVRDKYYYQLPEIPDPHLEKGEPRSWKGIALDGKLYVMGGVKKIDKKLWGSREVYVLDLAGQSGWKQCASMKEGRFDFGSGVLDGKIYVFGGLDCGNPVCGSEVYDPKENSWSEISSEICRRCDTHVATLGEELLLYDGRAYDPEHVLIQAYNDDGSLKMRSYRAMFWDVYHPVKDEWSKVRPFWGENSRGRVFMSKGKFYLMTDGLDAHIDVYDYEKNTWSHLHSSPFAGIAGTNHTSAVYDLVVVNDELLVALCNYYNQDTVLLRSNGLGSDKKEILWETENSSLPFDDDFFLCTLQL